MKYNIGVNHSSDEDMDGSPTFLEPLVNCTMKEGGKFRIACSIAGFPQPKVIWYHNKGKTQLLFYHKH